mgnify:CR=1 FL=1
MDESKIKSLIEEVKKLILGGRTEKEEDKNLLLSQTTQTKYLNLIVCLSINFLIIYM